MHLLVMKALGMPSSHPQQPRHGIFGDLDQASRGAHASAFVQMVDDRLGFFLRQLRVE
jgi:hypothetical protein